MATAFPGGLDSFTNPIGTDTLDSVSVPHASQHDNLNDAVAALEAKVGINSSAVPSSLDYKVSHVFGATTRWGTSAFSTIDLTTAITALGPNASNTNLVYFTAPFSMTTTQVRAIVIGTAAGSASFALYSIDSSDNGTRLTTAAMATTAAGPITASWGASQSLVAGSRYAIGLITTVGATWAGHAPGTNQTLEAGLLPRFTGQLAGSANPASFVAATPTNIASALYAVLL